MFFILRRRRRRAGDHVRELRRVKYRPMAVGFGQRKFPKPRASRSTGRYRDVQRRVIQFYRLSCVMAPTNIYSRAVVASSCVFCILFRRSPRLCVCVCVCACFFRSVSFILPSFVSYEIQNSACVFPFILHRQLFSVPRRFGRLRNRFLFFFSFFSSYLN